MEKRNLKIWEKNQLKRTYAACRKGKWGKFIKELN